MLPSCPSCAHRAHGDQPCPARFGGYGDSDPCLCGHSQFFERNLMATLDLPDDLIVMAVFDPERDVALRLVAA